MKISGVYKITNTVTGDFYIGSSKDVKKRWTAHKSPSRWNENPNNLMYHDMKRYGLDYFVFEILANVESEQLKETEQQFIETLKPTYNSYKANGIDSEKRRKTHNKAIRKYRQTEKGKKHTKEYNKNYCNQICSYNGEILTLDKLRYRFTKAGIEHPTIEAKKYLL